MAAESDCCYFVLTQDDIVRHLFDFISLFAPVAVLSVASLGIIRRDVHAVRADDAAAHEAIDDLLRMRSTGDGTAVAVVAEDDVLVGEIGPGVLDACGGGAEPASAALGALSADAVTTTCKYCSSSPLLNNCLDAAANTADASSLSSSPASSSSLSTTSSGSFPWRPIEYGATCHAGTSLVAVMGRALTRRVGYVWVVDDLSGELVGIVRFSDVLAVLRDYMRRLVPVC